MREVQEMNNWNNACEKLSNIICELNSSLVNIYDESYEDKIRFVIREDKFIYGNSRAHELITLTKRDFENGKNLNVTEFESLLTAHILWNGEISESNWRETPAEEIIDISKLSIKFTRKIIEAFNEEQIKANELVRQFFESYRNKE